ncbi:hypothetical protein [Nocardioides sambongensis]|uniref:hypothetical protein n=1 Tax=Nocardioides sambongensis TaxID=2589074 RepID=UPI00112A6D3D|nr:hypothetical protein [Nocardioides sambongensis]
MNLPDQPPTFRPAAGSEERPWTWRLEDAEGNEVALPAELAATHGGQRFPTQADAESWVGETWAELAEGGVAAVTLLEGDREVYGPMSLSA